MSLLDSWNVTAGLIYRGVSGYIGQKFAKIQAQLDFTSSGRSCSLRQSDLIM